MCGFDALMYAVCRKPVAFAPVAPEELDCALIRTLIPAATTTTRAARCLPLINVSLFLRRRDRRRLVESRRFDVYVRPDLRQLERIATVEACLRVLERHLPTTWARRAR